MAQLHLICILLLISLSGYGCQNNYEGQATINPSGNRTYWAGDILTATCVVNFPGKLVEFLIQFILNGTQVAGNETGNITYGPAGISAELTAYLQSGLNNTKVTCRAVRLNAGTVWIYPSNSLSLLLNSTLDRSESLVTNDSVIMITETVTTDVFTTAHTSNSTATNDTVTPVVAVSALVIIVLVPGVIITKAIWTCIKSQKSSYSPQMQNNLTQEDRVSTDSQFIFHKQSALNIPAGCKVVLPDTSNSSRVSGVTYSTFIASEGRADDDVVSEDNDDEDSTEVEKYFPSSKEAVRTQPKTATNRANANATAIDGKLQAHCISHSSLASCSIRGDDDVVVIEIDHTNINEQYNEGTVD